MGLTRKAKLDWDKVKADYLTGTKTLGQLAVRWKVSGSAIRMRAAREGWNDTPLDLDGQAAVASSVLEPVVQGLMGSGVHGPKQEAGETSPPVPSAGKPAFPDSGGVANHYQNALATYLISQVNQSITTHRIKPPTSWKDLATADTLIRKALGLDSKGGGVAVAVSIGGGTSGKMGPVDVTVDAVEASEEGE